MKISKFLYIFLLLVQIKAFGQAQSLKPFKINGTINADSGTVQLFMLSDTSFYPQKLHLTGKVQNKKFTISGVMPYPQGGSLRFNNTNSYYHSALIVIEKGEQGITIDIDSSGKVPEIHNTIYEKDYENYKAESKTFREEFAKFRHKSDSLYAFYKNELPIDIEQSLDKEWVKFYARSDSMLLRFVTNHPNSYIGLWKLIEIASFSGYENIFDSIYTKLSPELKGTYAGKRLLSRLQTSSLLAVGRKFNSLNFIDKESVPLSRAFYSKSKFTLVDFWYSNCSPCIAQFPKLAEIYKKFSASGFQVLGISIDKNEYKANWARAINKYKLEWPQYRDPGGREAIKLGINAFPTNFLLDSTGKIIFKNISLLELDELLKVKLL